jgi:hypothetical protein
MISLNNQSDERGETELALIKNDIKAVIKRHQRILRIARTIRNRGERPPQPVYSLRDSYIYAEQWASRLPRRYDCVIAIPRSALIIGQVIAQKHNIPLSTPDLFLQGDVWFTKMATENHKIKPNIQNFKTILLVEDVILNGREMMKAKQDIQTVYPNIKIEVGALFYNPTSKSFLDQYFTESKGYCLWDFLKGGFDIGTVASDLDGVICEDCPPEMDDDGDVYLQFVRNAIPKFIPSFELAAVITSRREKYREETELWLKKNGIRYRNLFMFPNAEERVLKKCVSLKVEGAKKAGAGWIWESDGPTAKSIYKMSGLPVFCTAEMSVRRQQTKKADNV